MRGLDPRIHPSLKESCKGDGWPAQARPSRIGVWCGPGSAERHEECRTASGTRGYLTVTGAGSGGTTVGCVPDTPEAGDNGAAFGPAIGCAEAVAVDAGGGPPGNTTTRVPTLTRSNKSETSSFSMPMQPEDTNLPMVDGWLVPWMR